MVCNCKKQTSQPISGVKTTSISRSSNLNKRLLNSTKKIASKKETANTTQTISTASIPQKEQTTANNTQTTANNTQTTANNTQPTTNNEQTAPKNNTTVTKSPSVVKPKPKRISKFIIRRVRW